MKMRGYTAEASLGRAGMYWHSAGADHMIVVLPQLRKPDYECVHDALKRAAPPTSATFSAPNREMKAAAVNSAVRDPDRVGVTGTRALADLERALPLIAIPI
jgi:hypothetical protein